MTEKRSSKAAIRKAILDQRDGMSAGDRKKASRKACDIFFENVRVPEKAIVAGYWPIRSEVDVLPILIELQNRGYGCALPHTPEKSAPLQFRMWSAESRMTPGKYGIAEPAEGRLVVPEVILVPMAAFDRTGHRLGYGAGFYDRTLASLKKVKPVTAIGLAYEEQIYNSLPADDNDIRMDMIVTDKNFYSFGEVRP